jgi:probable HAF family extracellular repeat protein
MNRTTVKSLPPPAVLPFFGTLLIIALSAPHARAGYLLTDLGTLGGITSTGAAINDSGYVVGTSTTSGGVTNAFEYNPVTQTMTNLSTVTGQATLAPTGINNSNVISGNTVVAGTPTANRYDSVNGLFSLGAGAARGINNGGVIIGSITSGIQHRTEEWSATNVPSTLFPSLNTQGYAIDNSGHFAGRTGSGSGTGGYYSNGSNQFTFTTGIAGFLPNKMSSNDIIAGLDESTVQAAMYNTATSTLTDLGFLLPTDTSSQAFGINDAGTIVGTSGSAGFLWTSTGGMQSLTSLLSSQFSGWTITSAAAINNSGQILAQGEFNGANHAVILTVPEPRALLLALGGVLPMLVLAVRSHRNALRESR